MAKVLLWRTEWLNYNEQYNIAILYFFLVLTFSCWPIIIWTKLLLLSRRTHSSKTFYIKIDLWENTKPIRHESTILFYSNLHDNNQDILSRIYPRKQLYKRSTGSSRKEALLLCRTWMTRQTSMPQFLKTHLAGKVVRISFPTYRFVFIFRPQWLPTRKTIRTIFIFQKAHDHNLSLL